MVAKAILPPLHSVTLLRRDSIASVLAPRRDCPDLHMIGRVQTNLTYTDLGKASLFAMLIEFGF